MEINEPKPLRELVAERRDCLKPVIGGLLRRKETLNIIAPAGTGKSRIAVRLAGCVAAGRPWFGCPCEQGRVLYVSADLPKDEIAERLETELMRLRPADRETALANIDVLDASGAGMSPDALERCLDRADGGDYSLVIVDSLDGLVPRNAESERRDRVLALHEAIDAHAIRRNRAFVLVQHMAADRTSAIFDDLSASWTSLAADSNIVLRPGSSDDGCGVCVTARSFDVAPLAMFRYAVSHALRAR